MLSWFGLVLISTATIQILFTMVLQWGTMRNCSNYKLVVIVRRATTDGCNLNSETTEMVNVLQFMAVILLTNLFAKMKFICIWVSYLPYPCKEVSKISLITWFHQLCQISSGKCLIRLPKSKVVTLSSNV